MSKEVKIVPGTGGGGTKGLVPSPPKPTKPKAVAGAYGYVPSPAPKPTAGKGIAGVVPSPAPKPPVKK